MDIINIDWFTCIVLALSIHRLSYMLVHEDGSLSIAYAIRLLGTKPILPKSNETKITFWYLWKRSLVNYSTDFNYTITNHFGKLLSCILCTSVWVSLLTVMLYLLVKDTYFVYIFYILALADITLLLERG